jgi:hypothetical protein
MAYVPGFVNDVFISYARADNDAVSHLDGWVRRFVTNLEQQLKFRIGLSNKEELKIFFDERDLHSNSHLDTLKKNAQESAAFVAIVSPSYVVRDWTKAELNAFLNGQDAADRIFCIESLPPEVPYPDALNGRFYTKFWTQRERSETKSPLSPDESSWTSKIQDVADDIKNLLRKLRESRGLDAAGKANVPLASIVAEPNRTVLLAQVTDDLDDDRDQVRRYLEQFDVSVLPRGTYPQGGEDFRKAFEADLLKANFFVQLVGQHASRCPPDMQQGYARFQYERVKREVHQRAVSILVWRRPDLDLASIVHRDRELLSVPEMLTMSFQSFKSEVIREIEQAGLKEKQLAPKESLGSDLLVFVNSVQEDQMVAHRVQRDFEHNGCTALLPLYGGDAAVWREDLEEKIIWCDALALVYGEAQPRWISSQVMAYSKLKRRRNEPVRVFLICHAPPRPKQKHGVAMPELREIDYDLEAPGDVIKNVVSEIIR